MIKYRLHGWDHTWVTRTDSCQWEMCIAALGCHRIGMPPHGASALIDVGHWPPLGRGGATAYYSTSRVVEHAYLQWFVEWHMHTSDVVSVSVREVSPMTFPGSQPYLSRSRHKLVAHINASDQLGRSRLQ